MTEDEAVESLSRLGLRTYEARVFVALHRLGTGTASDVSEIADVPRSQVYGAAEGLEERGLVEVQQSSPTKYRPVGLEEARRRLSREMRTEMDRAIESIADVQGSHEGTEPGTESVWTVEGGDAIRDRVLDLIGEATHRIIYATDDPERLDPRIADALEARAGEGIDVIGVTADEEVDDRFRSLDGLTPFRVPEALTPEISTGRALLVDRDAVLLSVLDTDYLPEATQETAIWGSGTDFSRVLVALLEEWMQNTYGLRE